MKYTTIKTKWNAWKKINLQDKSYSREKKIHLNLSVRIDKLNLFGLKLEWLCLLASSVTWRMRSSTATRNFSS